MSRTPGSCIVPTPFLNPGISCQGKKKEYKTHYYLSALRQKKGEEGEDKYAVKQLYKKAMKNLANFEAIKF